MAAQSGRGASRAILIALARSRFPVAGLPLECNSSGAEPPLLAGGIRGCPVSWNFRASAQPFTGYRPCPRKGASGPQMPTLSSCRTSLRKRPLPGRRGGFEGYHAPAIFSGLCRRPSAVAGLPRRRRGSPPVRPTVDRAFRMALPPGDTPLPLATSGPSQGGATSVDGARTPP